MILEHLPQVRLVARQIHERLPDHVALDDLISTGTIGLIAAIDRYDPSYNVQLNTYAEHKIRGAILDSLRSMDFAPRDRRKKARQVEEAIHRVEQRLGRQPKDEEIAADLSVDTEEYHRWLTEMRGLEVGNLQYVSGDETVDMLQFIPDDEENLPSRQFERSELERVVAEGITKMPKQERTVLSLYYQQELNVRQIAEVMQVHVSRVSQLKSSGGTSPADLPESRLFVQPKTASGRQRTRAGCSRADEFDRTGELREAAMYEDYGKSAAAGPENLELLLDMELPLDDPAGQGEDALGDVLDLDIGSTIELNRGADDAVDVVVNDHVVARGEVVVVDGNYGIRITEVASRGVRLESAGTPPPFQAGGAAGIDCPSGQGQNFHCVVED